MSPPIEKLIEFVPTLVNVCILYPPAIVIVPPVAKADSGKPFTYLKEPPVTLVLLALRTGIMKSPTQRLEN